MNELVVVSLTSAPVALGALYGFRCGGLRLAATWGPVLASWAVGVTTTLVSFRAGLFAPFGLVTPALLGMLAAGATAALIYRAARVVVRAAPSCRAPGNRLGGALVGLVGGVAAAASLWLALITVDGCMDSKARGAPAGERPAAGRWVHSLVRTANRGFLSHLPLVAPVTDEIEALLFVLNSDPELCRTLAEARGWEELRGLPSFQAIVTDFDILDEIDSVSAGNLAALYRLQRNPKVIAFVADEKVQAVLPGIRPSSLARELEEIAAER